MRGRILAIVVLIEIVTLSLLVAVPGGAGQAANSPAQQPDSSAWAAGAIASLPPQAAHPTVKPKVRNVESHLLQLGEQVANARALGEARPSTEARALPPALAALVTGGVIQTDGGTRALVYVDYEGGGAGIASQLRALGADVQIVSDDHRVIQASIDVAAVDAAAALRGVRYVRPAESVHFATGSVLTQGDALLLANQVRTNLGASGAGVRVGVISDGIAGLTASKASGDLGQVTAQSFRADLNLNAGPEGTAMLEIVHDLAPGAELWFANASTSLEFANAVSFLAANVDVLVDDLVNFDGPYDGTSIMSSASASNSTNPAKRERVHVNSAGNEALDHYQEVFVDSGFGVDEGGPTLAPVHHWQATGATTDAGFPVPCTTGSPISCASQFFLPNGGSAAVTLQWNDPFGGASDDYDIFLFDNATTVDASTNSQTGTQNPIEFVGATNNSGATKAYGFFISKFAGAAKTFDLFISCHPFCIPTPSGTDMNYNTLSSSIPNNADAGGNVLTLAAIDQADPGTDTAEAFSGRGPTNDIRNKPDMTAIDGVSVTGNGGFPVPFFGTSAASPHAGAIAALVLECFPVLKAGEPGDSVATDRATLRAKLTSGLTDLGTPGVDPTYGAGRMNAVTSTSGCPDGDGDHVLDYADNCPALANANQQNSDASAPDNGPGLAAPDTTAPNGDALGDACDPDDDNDGLPDVAEAVLAGCGAFDGLTTTHPNPAGGDVTNDDNGNGNQAPPAGTDAADNGPSWDTDNDGVIDGYECAHGSNPRDAMSKPPALPDDGADDDGDGLLNGWERRGWGTDPHNADTDGDGKGDCVEAVDVDGNGTANFSGDTVNTAKASFGVIGKTQDFDLDRNGIVNFSGDAVNSAKRTLGVVPCL